MKLILILLMLALAAAFVSGCATMNSISEKAAPTKVDGYISVSAEKQF